jgi:hypothetical protein
MKLFGKGDDIGGSGRSGKMPVIDAKFAAKVFRLAFWFAAVMICYILVLKYEFAAGYLAIHISAAILICAVFLLTRGFSKKEPTAADFGGNLSPAELEEKIEKAKKNRETARSLLYPLIPLIAVVIFDLIWVTWFS